MKKQPQPPQLIDFVNRYSGKVLSNAKTREQRYAIAFEAVAELGPAADKFLRMLAYCLAGGFSIHLAAPGYFELSLKLKNGTTLVGKADNLHDAIKAALHSLPIPPKH